MQNPSGQTGSIPPTLPNWGRLWQLPIFLMGLLAFLAAGVWWFLAPPSPDYDIDRKLFTAWELLKTENLETARKLAETVDQQLAPDDVRRSETHLLRGLVRFRQAQQAPDNQKTDLFGESLALLQEARRRGVKNEAEKLLRFAMAVSEYYTGGDPAQAAREIEAVLDHLPEERVAGYKLLIQLHLERRPPDLNAALRASERLLAQAGLSDPNPIRLLRGKLLLQKGEIEEAHVVLRRIPPDAAEYVQAQHLMAWSRCEQGAWQAALDLWEPLLKGSQNLSPVLNQALFGMGACYLALGRLAEMQTVWQRLEREAPRAPETRVAVFQLALVHARLGHYDDALSQLRVALEHLTPGWQGPYADAQTWRNDLEALWSEWQRNGKYREAAELARLYAAIALPGESARRRGLALREEGLRLLREAERETGSRRQQALSEGRQTLHEAAQCLLQAVRELDQAGDSGDLLWLAADGFMQARQFDQAEAILELGLRGGFPPQRKTDAQMALAETLLAQGKREPAARLLRQCAGQPGPQQMRAKYLLALVLIDLGEYDEAEAHLKEVVTVPALSSTADLPRLARFALVHVLFRREAFAEAADYLEKALTEDHQPQTIATRYWLAEAHRRAARQETRGIGASDGSAAREFYLKLKQERLRKAIEQFDRVIAALQTARQRGDLAGEELLRLRESQVGRAECLMLLGRYDEAIADLTRFLHDEPPSVSTLTAAMYLTQAHLAQQRLELAQESARRGRQILDQLSDEDLASARTSRRVWQEWFDRVAALQRQADGP